MNSIIVPKERSIFNDNTKSLEIRAESKEIQKIERISLNLFRSHLMGILLKVTAVIGFRAVFLKPSVIAALPRSWISVPFSSLIGYGGTFLLTVEVIRLFKKLVFEISLIFTSFSSKEWWNPITDKIVLGAIPIGTHLDRLHKHVKVDAVLTLLEPFELEEGLVQPVRSNDWQDRRIAHLHIHAKDFIPLLVDQIEQGIAFVHGHVKNDKRVYIHCKAGRGRSATIVVAYLLKYGLQERQFSNFEEAYDYVKQYRPSINLNRFQKAAINAWHGRFLSK